MKEAFRVGLTRDFLREDGTVGWGDIGLASLDEADGIEREFLPEGGPELTAEQVGSYDALILLSPRVSSATVEGADRLALVARFGIGYGNVDLEACTRNGVAVTITPDRRGAAFGIGHDDYEAAEDVVSGMQHANDETLLIAQIETTDGIENVEEIAAVDGLDVLWIGHNDLTNSIGVPGQFDHPDYLRAVNRFLEACADNDKAPGIMSTSVEEARFQVIRVSVAWPTGATSGSTQASCGKE